MTRAMCQRVKELNPETYYHGGLMDFQDPELQAMQTITEVLEPLDRGARKRVLFWARHRFVPPMLLDFTGPNDATEE